MSQYFGEKLRFIKWRLPRFLPPAYEVRGKAVFTGVCLSTFRGGWGDTPSGRRGGGTPVQSQWGGGNSIQPTGGIPIWLTRGGYPHLANLGGYPPQVGTGQGAPSPQSGLDGGTPPVRTGLGPPPHQDWMGVHPPPLREIRRQRSYVAGGMPLAFTRENFLVSTSVSTRSLL